MLEGQMTGESRQIVGGGNCLLVISAGGNGIHPKCDLDVCTGLGGGGGGDVEGAHSTPASDPPQAKFLVGDVW